jgi:NCS2 family nucleobase:cation symporter-2/xanthine permease XanP
VPQSDDSALRYEVGDRPPHLLAAALGFQIVVLILAGIILIPIIVLKSAGASPEVTTWAIFAALLVSGLTTILQGRPLGPIGSGFPLFMGTSGAFIAVSTQAVKEGGLPLLATLVVVSSLIQFLFSARLSLLRKVITPTVGGTVIMLIAVAIFPICFRLIGSVPAHIDPSSAAGPVSAGVTFFVILGISLLSAGQLRLWGPLIGTVVGTLVASYFGLVDLARVHAAAWIGLPSAAWPGLDLSFDQRLWGLLPAFLIVTIVGAIETYGDGIAIQRVSVRSRRPVDFKAVQGAVNADGVGNLLSGLAGTLPNTTYATSISVVVLTRVAATRVAVYGGLLMMVFAFLPKISAVLQAIPDAVVGAYVLILLVLLFAQGLSMVSEGGLTYENGIVVCLSFWLGMGFQNQLVFPDHLPQWAHTLLDSGMTSGSFVAVLLTLVLAIKNRSQDRVTLQASVAAIPELQTFLARLATTVGWDKTASDRLQLAGEEALLFLIDKEEQASRTRPTPIRLSARESAGQLELEFLSGPGAENIENLVSELGEKPRATEQEAGLRVLSHFATALRHEQFHDRNYLLVVVDSRPLS